MEKEKLNEYIPARGYECHNACLVNILNIKGIHILTSDVYFSVNGNVMNSKENGEQLLMHSNHHFFDKYKVTSIRECWDANEDTRKLFQQLSDDVFISIKIRPEMLGYSETFLTNRGLGHFVNVLAVEEDRIFIVDGYVSALEGETFKGWFDYDEVIKAWKEEGYVYRRITDIDASRFQDIKEESKKHFMDYMKKHLSSEKTAALDNPRIQLLVYFEYFMDKCYSERSFNEEYCEQFLYDANFNGFLIVKSIIWEKINEIYGTESEEYRNIFNQWKHILLCIRKAVYCGRYEKLKSIYSNVVELNERESNYYRCLINKSDKPE